MPVDLRNRSFVKELDVTTEELRFLIDLSADLKRAKRDGTEVPRLAGKNIALIFEKTSTRTRCAFEVAAYDQGAHVTYLGPTGTQIGHKESMKDTARVLGRMYDAIEYRGFGQESRGRARALRRGARLQRPHRRVPPDPDARGHAHDAGALGQGACRRDLLLPRGRAVQHRELADDHRVQARHGRPDLRAEGAVARRGARRDRARGGRGDRRDPHAHRRHRRGRARRRLPVHRRLGVDGRGRLGLEGADRPAAALPGERRRAGAHRQPGHAVHALPARVPRPRDEARRADLRGASGSTRSRSRTRSSSRSVRSCSTRPRTGCTRSRPCWSRRWETARDERRRSVWTRRSGRSAR